MKGPDVKTAGHGGRAILTPMANSFQALCSLPSTVERYLLVSMILPDRRHIRTLHKIPRPFFSVGRSCDKCRVQICSDVKPSVT